LCNGKRRGVWGYWSPDSKYFATIIADQRNVKPLWVINSIAEPRPTLETYKYEMPGETGMPEYHLYLFDVQAGTRKPPHNTTANRIFFIIFSFYLSIKQKRHKETKPASQLCTSLCPFILFFYKFIRTRTSVHH
jgi:hypothetical protein